LILVGFFIFLFPGSCGVSSVFFVGVWVASLWCFFFVFFFFFSFLWLGLSGCVYGELVGLGGGFLFFFFCSFFLLWGGGGCWSVWLWWSAVGWFFPLLGVDFFLWVVFVGAFFVWWGFGCGVVSGGRALCVVGLFGFGDLCVCGGLFVFFLFFCVWAAVVLSHLWCVCGAGGVFGLFLLFFFFFFRFPRLLRGTAHYMCPSLIPSGLHLLNRSLVDRGIHRTVLSFFRTGCSFPRCANSEF